MILIELICPYRTQLITYNQPAPEKTKVEYLQLLNLTVWISHIIIRPLKLVYFDTKKTSTVKNIVNFIKICLVQLESFIQKTL